MGISLRERKMIFEVRKAISEGRPQEYIDSIKKKFHPQIYNRLYIPKENPIFVKKCSYCGEKGILGYISKRVDPPLIICKKCREESINKIDERFLSPNFLIR